MHDNIMIPNTECWYMYVLQFRCCILHMVINPVKFDDTLPYIKQDCTSVQLSIDNSMIQKNDNSISYKVSGIQFIAKPTMYSQFFPTNKRCGNVENWPLSGVYIMQALTHCALYKRHSTKDKNQMSTWHWIMHSHCSLSFFTMWTSFGQMNTQ